MATIIEEPEYPRRLTDPHLRAAYRDGWNVAANGAPRVPRPNYLTDAERQAFDSGWELRNMIGLLP